ncbi:hypothetical protein ACFSO7_02590 [Bacillus sp. CGMCC 1.16607]|uniref:hypothetical protein n=1 Tax=Bacillus sp. CGMCC 1.16607 TaxID=3351842 RepID=UPI0036290A85
MPQEKLTIVPVSLHSENKYTFPLTSPISHSSGCCTIKTANAEVSFYNGIEGQIIQTIMRELKHW